MTRCHGKIIAPGIIFISTIHGGHGKERRYQDGLYPKIARANFSVCSGWVVSVNALKAALDKVLWVDCNNQRLKMKALIQRVAQARVEVSGEVKGEIQQGILLLLGIEKTDTQDIALRLLKKVLNYRIFSDENERMNLNLQQVEGEVLVVSQFTLVADTKKGTRPGFSKGASPEFGETLYDFFVEKCALQMPTQTGCYGADMQVSLMNDGPVTFMLEVN